MATRSYKRPKRPITAEDKLFIKLQGQGKPRSEAFRIAYADNPTVKKYADIVKGGGDPVERQRLRRSIVGLSKSKVQTKHMREAIEDYNKKMEEFTNKAVDTAIDLVENARSEKVRADLAIEGMRHRVGTPVQKVQVKEEKTVILTFGDQHPDDAPDLIEGEVVDDNLLE